MSGNTSGSAIQSIENRQFMTINTPYAAEIVHGLEQSGIAYSAKFTETSLSLVYPEQEKKRVNEILKKAQTDEETIERIRNYQGSEDEILVLLPEIADILDTSVSRLRKNPADVQERLAETYINYWHSDDQTILKALKNVLVFDREAEIKLDTAAAQKQAPAAVMEQPHTEKQHSEQENQIKKQREMQKTGGFFSRERLRRESIRQSQIAKQREQEVDEMNRTKS